MCRLAGMEEYLVQDSHSVGRAGSAHVGLFNGNLVFTHQETSHERQPDADVDLTRVQHLLQ